MFLQPFKKVTKKVQPNDPKIGHVASIKLLRLVTGLLRAKMYPIIKWSKNVISTFMDGFTPHGVCFDVCTKVSLIICVSNSSCLCIDTDPALVVFSLVFYFSSFD